jgi:uncharacterized protein YbjT (DUF2867 family)
MRIAILGGAGTLGSHVTAELTARGHDVRVLSRHSQQYPVDLTTGQGLAAAIDGCSAVIDASNASAPKRAAQVLVEGSRRLLAAEQECGVGHHVGISIVGCERVPTGYYRVKAAQEEVISAGPVPWTLVRATQFHELVDMALRVAARWRVVPIPAARFQTIAAAEVAQVVSDAAEREPQLGRIQVAGPQVLTAAELARTWLSVTGRRAVSVPVPVPGKLGRALRAGELTDRDADVLGTLTFADWLGARVAREHAPTTPGAGS